MDSQAMPDTATFTEFARLAGFRRSYVTQLRKDGRLVLSGRRVCVRESIDQIRATADPSKSGVVERHAAERGHALHIDDATGTDAGDDTTDADNVQTIGGMSYQTARAVKEQYQAMAAKRDYEISMQQLLNAEDVRQAVLSAITTLRSRLETMPDTLGPQVAAAHDEGKARAILADAMERALGEVAREFQQLNGAEE